MHAVAYPFFFKKEATVRRSGSMRGGEKVLRTPYCPIRWGYLPVWNPYRVGVQLAADKPRS